MELPLFSIVKLLNNFRSHPSILEFSNRHFYKSKLKACGDLVITHSLEDTKQLPKKCFPIIFHKRRLPEKCKSRYRRWSRKWMS